MRHGTVGCLAGLFGAGMLVAAGCSASGDNGMTDPEGGTTTDTGNPDQDGGNGGSEGGPGDSGNTNGSPACSSDAECDDGVACTTDACDPANGCQNMPDDSMCTGGGGGPCKQRVCNPSSGCQTANRQDGAMCNIPGGGTGNCSAGACMGLAAFRGTGMTIRDPHFILDATRAAGTCTLCDDITNQQGSCEGLNPITAPPLNPGLQDAIMNDANDDGHLDFSIMAVFKPLVQDGTSGQVRLIEGLCDAGAPETCNPDPMSSVDATVNYQTKAGGSGETCLGPKSGTVYQGTWPDGQQSNVRVVTAGEHGCFVTQPQAITLTFQLENQTLSIHIRDAQFAGQFTGNPATGYQNGLLRGFWRKSDADSATIMPPDFGNPISVGDDMLPDNGSVCGQSETHCEPADPGMGEGTTPDSRDMHDGNCGWWLYAHINGDRAENASGF